jgi:hypothetical protein
MVRGEGGRTFTTERGDGGRTFATERGNGWNREHHGRGGRFGYRYGYDSYAYGDGDCYLVRRRVLTPFGWRVRRVQVCD